jgi:hypothetical protein
MTPADLERLVPSAPWFTRLGHREDLRDVWALRSIDDAVDQLWDWLPTSHDQQDPIHSDALKRKLEEIGLDENRKSAELKYTQLVLRSLRRVVRPVPELMVGPHDFHESACGGACFVVRMVARETLTGLQGFWCKLMPYYFEGHWPCGLAADGRLVVL